MKTILTFFAFVLPVLCYATEPAKVNFKCNIHTINKEEGQPKDPIDDEYGGYVIIYKSRHPDEQVGRMGLLIIRDCHSLDDENPNYWAYDLECPKCKSEGIQNEIIMKTIILAECPRCRAEWQNIHMGSAGQTNGIGKYWLIAYKTVLQGDILTICNW